LLLLRWLEKMAVMNAILSPTHTRNKPKLLDQVRDVIRRKHFSIRTEQTYVDWIKRYILFHGKRHPREMAEAEITAFLTHLARVGKVAASTQNQALSALLSSTKRCCNRKLVGLIKSSAQSARARRPFQRSAGASATLIVRGLERKRSTSSL